MFRQILRPVIQNTRIGTRSYHVPHEVRPPHLDEIPVPSGPWKESYNRDNRKYNMQLAVGVISLLGTIAIGRYNGMLWLNYDAPVPKPKPEE